MNEKPIPTETDKDEPETRRVRLYMIPMAHLFKWLNGGLVKCEPDLNFEEAGIPDTAKMIEIAGATDRKSLGVILEDPSFDEVEVGKEVPEIQITWTAGLSVMKI